ncbi:MAG TPA: hypothetical protein VML75_13050 [Kofleriaceae bacterium]|nr:hypothetical protein [Kofleriaceae bacterium]
MKALALLLLMLTAGCPGAPIGPRLPLAPIGSAEDTATELRAFLDAGRTPSRTIEVARTGAPGFTPVDLLGVSEQRVRPGDRLLFVNRDRSAIFVIVGRQPLQRSGARILAAHIDTPSPRLLLTGLSRRGQTELELRHYGGLRPHHWLQTPVGVVGRVARAGGQELEVSLGLDDDDFAFHIEQRGDKLLLHASSTPTDAPKPGQTARTFVDAMHARYGLTARDLETSELYAVPRHRAREVGVDRELIGAHGQDDRVNSYAAWRAITDVVGTPEHTAMVWLVDREEIGSSGTTGARSAFFELVYAWLLRGEGTPATEVAMSRAFAASVCLSADTPAGINPNFPEVHEAKNAPLLGRGPAIFPFTGSRGKMGGSAAHPELISSIDAAFSAANAPLQFGELGRVDEGGGGTVAKYLGHRGIDVVDVGIPVVSMHSPLELSAKADVFAAYRGFAAWLGQGATP